jgi:hypothetical protein
MLEEQIVTDEEITKAWGNASFGICKRVALKYALLKVMCKPECRQSHTMTKILEELELITPKYRVTKKGREYIWAVFNKNNVSI